MSTAALCRKLNILKFEFYCGPRLEDRHGYDSLIFVGHGQFQAHKLESKFIKAAQHFSWPEVEDSNDLGLGDPDVLQLAGTPVTSEDRN